MFRAVAAPPLKQQPHHKMGAIAPSRLNARQIGPGPLHCSRSKVRLGSQSGAKVASKVGPLFSKSGATFFQKVVPLFFQKMGPLFDSKVGPSLRRQEAATTPRAEMEAGLGAQRRSRPPPRTIEKSPAARNKSEISKKRNFHILVRIFLCGPYIYAEQTLGHANGENMAGHHSMQTLPSLDYMGRSSISRNPVQFRLYGGGCPPLKRRSQA